MSNWLDAMQSVAALTEQVPLEDDIVLDFYTWQDGTIVAPIVAQEEVHLDHQRCSFPS